MALLDNVAKSVAPRGATFNGRRRIVTSSSTRLASRTISGSSSAPWILGIVAAAVGCLLALLKERSVRSAAHLALSTPLSTILELRYVLRGAVTDRYCAEPAHLAGQPAPMSPAFRGVTNAVYARLAGRLWVPPPELVRGPYSQQTGAFFEAKTYREFDRWVTTKQRRQIKKGRPAKDDDSGSDSEYEEVEQGSWVAQSELSSSERRVAPRLYIEDDTGRALVDLPNRESWCAEHSENVFSDRVASAATPLGTAVLAAAASALTGGGLQTRDRGRRREEASVKVGERIEVQGEVRVNRDGSLCIQEVSEPQAQLHRLQSLSLDAAPGSDSQLQCKQFQASILRSRQSLADLHLAKAVWCRVAKLLLGSTSTLLLVLRLYSSLTRPRRATASKFYDV